MKVDEQERYRRKSAPDMYGPSGDSISMAHCMLLRGNNVNLCREQYTVPLISVTTRLGQVPVPARV